MKSLDPTAIPFFNILSNHHTICPSSCTREFPGSLVIRIQRFHCCGLSLTSGQGTKNLQAAWRAKKIFFHTAAAPFCIFDLL